VLLVLKPSYLPLALMGVRWRSWWIAAAAVAVLCLPFGGLWFDFAMVLRGSPVEPWYSLLNLPYVAIPIFGWLGRDHRAITGLRRVPILNG